MKQVSLTVLLCILATVSAFPFYRDLIPNGKKVPHPCKPNYVWKGVGHENQGGGGYRNPFGMDWEANGMKWDECLCSKDSDGDGRTNGEELGDPDCEWTPGNPAKTTKGLSHPGVCEPMDDETCMEKNNWDIDCSALEFTCDELEATQDVRTTTVRLDAGTPVPAEETTYICQLLELPSDGDYHLIASEPLIDNEYVMHHLILYGCDAENVTDLREKFGTPTSCGMETLTCSALLDGWTVGSPGNCLPEEFGIRIGTEGFKYALIEMHWNNPELRSDYTDSSGLILYYTPNLRPNHGSSFFAGPVYLEIPPGYSEVVNQGGCSPYCSNLLFQENIKITSIEPHMHYLGRKMTVELKRDGISLGVILEENDFNYDSPRSYVYDPPLIYQPGDEMVVTCTFDSSGSDSYVFYGDGTSDEMCLATVSYYPKQPHADNCLTNGNVGYCQGDIITNETAECFGSLEALFSQEGGVFADFYGILFANCDPEGVECWPNCPDALKEVRQHVCFQGIAETALKSYLAFFQLDEFLQFYVSCDERPEMWYKPAEEYKPPQGEGGNSVCVSPPSKAGTTSTSVFWLLALLIVGKMI